jgi:hypothetical protein
MMNTTPESNRDKLDRLLDETLNQLPEREAPESLFSNIMARVSEEEEAQRLSWFARLQWPVVLVSACFVFLATYFSGDAISYLSNLVTTGQFAGEIESVNSGIQLFSTILHALGKVIGLIPPVALYSAAAVAVAFSACTFAGMGTVIFRLTRPATL